MRTFKLIDCIISIALIVFFLMEYIFNPADDRLEQLIRAYLIVGGWQTLSMIIHAITKTHTRRFGTRHIYHWITFISLVTMPAGSFWILGVTAPFMAVFYTWLCVSEYLKYYYNKTYY